MVFEKGKNDEDNAKNDGNDSVDFEAVSPTSFVVYVLIFPDDVWGLRSLCYIQVFAK